MGIYFTTEGTESHRVFSFYKLMTDIADSNLFKNSVRLCVLRGEN